MVSAVYLLAAVQLASGTIMPMRRSQTNPAPLQATNRGILFNVELKFADQTFLVLVDTGSSDTWVVEQGFRCIDKANNLEQPAEACNFASTYERSDSFEVVENQIFGVQYGTGIALGTVGLEDVTIGGITVTNQTVGVVDSTTEVGDGFASGILGLGYRPLTSAHPGTTIANNTLLLNRSTYDPLFISMYKQGLVEPWYSVAIERLPKGEMEGPGGWLGLGELPPVAHSDNWAVKPVEVTQGIPDEFDGGIEEITLMTLTVDGITWGDGDGSMRTNETAFQAVVDTGIPTNQIPSAVAASVNALFDPPGVLNEDLQLYVVDCDAKTPRVGIILDGQTFWHQPEDMIIELDEGLCVSSTGPTGEGSGVELNFLGDAFLRNVVSVFDLGKDEMRFAARTEGTDDDGSEGEGADGSGSSAARVLSPSGAAWIAFALFGLVPFGLT